MIAGGSIIARIRTGLLAVSPAAWIGFLLLLIYLLAQFGRGAGSTLEITDHLDIDVPIYSILSWQQLFGPGDAIIPNIIGGVPRWALASPLKLDALLQVRLGSLAGIILYESLTRILGFWFMGRLLQREVGIADPVVAWGVALCYAILPINYSTIGLLMLLPMLACCYLQLVRGHSWWWALGLAVYPFFGGIQLGFPAFIMLAGIVLRIGLTERQRLNRAVALLAGFLAFYIAFDHDILLQFVAGQGFVSHRTERMWERETPMAAVGALLVTLFDGGPEHHARALAMPIITLSLIIAMILVAFPAFRDRRPGGLFWGIMLLFLAMSIVYAIWRQPFSLDLQDKLKITNFYLRRFIYLAPLMLYVAWALILARTVRWRPLIAVLLLGQLFYVARDSQAAMPLRDPKAMSFAQYFAKPQFQAIRDRIGKPQNSYRIVSLGIPVNLPLVSGFHQLDGYLTNYPLEYKHRFRRVIEPELQRAPFDPNDPATPHVEFLRGLITNWANTLQIYTIELWFYWIDVMDKHGTRQWQVKEMRRPITLKIDFAGFCPYGVHYLISAAAIETSPDNHLKMIDTFDADNSPYQLRLYQILNDKGIPCDTPPR